MNRFAAFSVLILFLFTSTVSCDLASDDNPSDAPFPCEDGRADRVYPCENVDLFAHISIRDMTGPNSGVGANDIWGWTDPSTQREYVLVGLTNGVTFVDITDPAEPVIMGHLQEQLNPSSLQKSESLHDDEKGESAWRDIKVYDNHAFIVSDNQPHGLQVFDLTKLRETSGIPYDYEEDAHYSEFGRAHNIAINEETGYGYVVGSETYGGGLHILDLSTPLQPTFAGFHSDSTTGRRNTGYVHDTQCVIYEGPDTDYTGEELCFNSGETHLVVANVTDKANTYSISATSYTGLAYAHQGWLTEDHRYFLLDDELDQGNTTTYIFDMQDLDAPVMIGTHQAPSQSIDHNQYVHQGHTYQSNYTSGLRILDVSDIANANLTEKAFFDTFPINNNRAFDGSWSNYPYFESGMVVINDMSNGLFIVRPNLEP